MIFKLYFTEYHSDIKFWTEQGYLLTATDDDGWGEFEHRQVFEADSIEEAKAMVHDLSEMQSNSSGVFNVYHEGELVFTEEEL